MDLNHKTVFRNFWQILKPNAQLLVQCCGYGNFTKTLSVFNKIRKSLQSVIIFATIKGKSIGMHNDIL